MAGSKSILTEILATKLPPLERQKFMEWSNSVANEDFDAGLTSFFTLSKVQDLIGEYAIEQLQELEMHCNIKVSAIIHVQGKIYQYRQVDDLGV